MAAHPFGQAELNKPLGESAKVGIAPPLKATTGETMDHLFKREQTAARIGRVAFKLWGKIELSEEEQALVKRYKFDETLLLLELTAKPRLHRRFDGSANSHP